MTATDRVWGIVAPGVPLPPKPTEGVSSQAGLATLRHGITVTNIPGLYVEQDDTPDHAASVYVLDANGFLWPLGRAEEPIADAASFIDTHLLERLVRHSETDL